MENKYMFDTNIYNRIHSGVLNTSVFMGKGQFKSTHIQLDELNKTKDPRKREQLILIFEEVAEDNVATDSSVLGKSRLDLAKLGYEAIVPIETMVWGKSPWGMDKWGADGGLYEPIKKHLDVLNGCKPNNIEDALIAETAIKNKFILVTEDHDLLKVAKEFGANSLTLDEFKKRVS